MVSLLSGVDFLREFGVFTVVFPFLLIATISYGILSYVKPFGEDNFVNAILAFIIAFMALQFMPILIFIQLIVPYIMGFFLIMFLVWTLFKFLGADDATLSAVLKHPAVYGVIIAVLLIGVFVFLSESFPVLSVDNQGGSISSSGINDGSGYDKTDSGQNIIVTETDDGTVTIIEGSDSLSDDQDLLRNTIFHPTILSLLVMLIVFGTASYYIMVIKVA